LRARDRAIQRLHDDPAIANASPHPALDDLLAADLPILRAGPGRADRLAAWRAGETGYPLVDAAMRQLRATGWLPHPLRALVVAFAAHALWLPWQRLDPFLAKQWLDYEPGIHLDQLQHHAGVGPAAPPRYPDPVALGQASDPAGAYVRRWLPALRALPDAYLHQPWLLPAAEQDRLGCRIGTHYPAPITDHAAAARAARAAIAACRRRPSVAAALTAARASVDNPQPAAQQLTLF
jgi:deoxyribodipyrimidine photo-lyase